MTCRNTFCSRDLILPRDLNVDRLAVWWEHHVLKYLIAKMATFSEFSLPLGDS